MTKATKHNDPRYDSLHEETEREALLHAIEHFAHVLPAQATIRDFVHHNTLHGFEHLKFQDALKAANELTGAYGYWPQEKSREAYLKGRIVDRDINTVLLKDPDINADDVIFGDFDASGLGNSIKRQDVYRIASLFPLKKISSCQLKWQSEEAHAFERIQKDVPEGIRSKILEAHPPTFTARSSNKEKHHVKVGGCASEKEIIEDLWAACVEVLELNPMLLHPEDLMNLDAERAENIFSHIIISALESYTGVGLAALFGIILGAAYFLGIFRKAFLGECRNEIVADAEDLKRRELLIIVVMSSIVLVVGVYPQLVLGVIQGASEDWINLLTKK